MGAAPTLTAKKAVDIQVLHCLNPRCGGLLAYEVDSNHVLYVDLAWTARRDDTGKQYFPRPKCGGNIVEEFRTPTGVLKHQVTRGEEH